MRSYQRLLQYILDNGESHDDRTGVGTTSVFGYQWRHDMRDGFPLLTTKKVFLGWVWDELQWFLEGSTSEPRLQEISKLNGRKKPCDIWKEWATRAITEPFGREEGDLGPVYGEMWRCFPVGRLAGTGLDAHGGFVDQIKQAVKNLKHQPNSRRNIVSGWHPYYQSQVALPPCHTLFQLKTHRDRELSLHLYARSIDAFLGLPYNIASYGLLLSLFAHCCEFTPRDLIISFGDLHIYNNHKNQVQEQLSRDPLELPSVHFSEELRGKWIDGIGQANGDDVHLEDYHSHSAIKAPVAI